MSDPSLDAPGRRRRPLAAAGGLLVAGTVGVLIALVLGSWAADQALTTRLWRVETVVGTVVVAVGTVAAAWVGTSALVAATCALVRAAGGAWRAGEVAVQRWAPGVVRRALVVAVAAGVGLGTAVGAQATVAPPVEAVAVDLGWAPTATAPASVDSGAPVDADAPGAPEAPATWPATGTEPSAHAAPSDTHPADQAEEGGPRPSEQDRPAHRSTVPDAAGTAHPVVADLPAAVPPATDPTWPPPAPAPPATPTATTGTLVVQAGDTLWGLAARALGADASDAAIATEWPRWYAANAATIGPDPDVLVPGQVLHVPGTTDGGDR